MNEIEKFYKTNEEPIVHRVLVCKGAVYMLSALRCNPVFMERGSARNNEIPDIIGWNQNCIIIECKTSIDDLKADANKPFRQNPDEGMGTYRYYLIPESLYRKLQETNKLDKYIPDEWGLLIYDYNKMIYKVRKRFPKEYRSNLLAERNYLRSRILQIQRFGCDV